jgi:hypothetical protein
MAEPTQSTSGAVLAVDQKLSQLSTKLDLPADGTVKNVLTNYGTDPLCVGQLTQARQFISMTTVGTN